MTLCKTYANAGFHEDKCLQPNNPTLSRQLLWKCTSLLSKNDGFAASASAFSPAYVQLHL